MSLSPRLVPIQLPIGAESDFTGIIDLVTMKAEIYHNEDGTDYSEEEIPENMKELADEYHEKLIESVAELDEELMEKYFGGEEITIDEIKTVIRKATIDNTMVPVTCGSSYRNKGVQMMLDAVIDYMPAPTDIPAIKGTNPETDAEEERPASDDEPFAALAFKIATDPFVGKLCFFRVYSGNRIQLCQGQQRASGQNPPDARQRQKGYRMLLQRRYRGCCRPEEHHHRRHTLRREAPDHPRVHGIPRACNPRCHRAQDQSRSGEDGYRSCEAR